MDDKELKLKEYEKQIEAYKKRQGEVDSADKEYQKLIAEAKDKLKLLQIERHALDQERVTMGKSLKEAEEANSHTSANWSKQEASVTSERLTLEQEKKYFAYEKASIKADLAKLDDSRSANTILLQKLEKKGKELDAKKLTLDKQQADFSSTQLVSKTRLDEESKKMAEEKNRLTKWEEELKYIDLELKVKQRDVSKLARIEHLKKEVKSL